MSPDNPDLFVAKQKSLLALLPDAIAPKQLILQEFDSILFDCAEAIAYHQNLIVRAIHHQFSEPD
jgi:hypothetical protein